MKEHQIGNQKYIDYGEGEPTQQEEKEARRILRNKFNHQEVGIQTRIKVIREKGVSTSKPCLKKFSSEVSQSMIYDAYMDYCKRNRPERLQELGLMEKLVAQKGEE